MHSISDLIQMIGNGNITRSISEELKIYILCAAIVLAILWNIVSIKRTQKILIFLCVFASLNYARFGTNLLTNKIDSYDLMHYYINPKYINQLGYYDLYPAVMLVDHENSGPYFKEGKRYLAQDNSGHNMRSIQHGIKRGKEVKEKFSKEEWDNFSKDVLWLQRESTGFSNKLWRQMLQDHGYNGTPAWMLIAKPFTHIFPMSAIKLLCYLDLGLLVGTCVYLGTVYSATSGLWLWLFFMTSYSLRWPTITWAFLRYDYICALLIAMGLLKQKKGLLAGMLSGFAAAARFFPAMWMFGPFCKGVIGLVQRKLHRSLLFLGLGCLLGIGILQVGSMAVFGPSTVTSHFENMIDHNKADQLSSRRIGMALALPYRGETLPKYIEPERKTKIQEQRPLRFAISALMLALFGWGLRNKDDDETFAMGFIPFFLLTTASYYYYVARATLIVLHASKIQFKRHQFGLYWLLGLELFSNAAETILSGHRVFLIGSLSWGILLYTIIMGIWILLEKPVNNTSTETPQKLPSKE
jgi:hypothetical protein